MTTLPKISLNEKWRYRYVADDENYAMWDIADLDWEWTLYTQLPMSSIPASHKVWLRKRFTLLQTDECVRYFLRSDYCAFPMKFYLRGELIAELSAKEGLDIEVTDYVTLDDNLLVIAIEASERLPESQAKELYLQPFFCSDLG